MIEIVGSDFSHPADVYLTRLGPLRTCIMGLHSTTTRNTTLSAISGVFGIEHVDQLIFE